MFYLVSNTYGGFSDYYSPFPPLSLFSSSTRKLTLSQKLAYRERYVAPNIPFGTSFFTSSVLPLSSDMNNGSTFFNLNIILTYNRPKRKGWRGDAPRGGRGDG
jgi:hypothetical protein